MEGRCCLLVATRHRSRQKSTTRACRVLTRTLRRARAFPRRSRCSPPSPRPPPRRSPRARASPRRDRALRRGPARRLPLRREPAPRPRDEGGRRLRDQPERLPVHPGPQGGLRHVRGHRRVHPVRGALHRPHGDGRLRHRPRPGAPHRRRHPRAARVEEHPRPRALRLLHRLPREHHPRGRLRHPAPDPERRDERAPVQAVPGLPRPLPARRGGARGGGARIPARELDGEALATELPPSRGARRPRTRR